MPRVTPVAGKADVAPEHQAVVGDVLGVFGAGASAPGSRP
jgi:hypothetical protein